jgi:hypothetical protein
VFLKSPATDTESVVILNSRADLIDHLDPDGFALFGKSMNDLQKIELFNEMAVEINARLLKNNSIEELEELANKTY